MHLIPGMKNILCNPGIDYDADHLVEAMRYALYTAKLQQQLELKAYACECKHCNLTSYTNFKQLNCRYCGSSDPDVFECRELK